LPSAGHIATGPPETAGTSGETVSCETEFRFPPRRNNLVNGPVTMCPRFGKNPIYKYYILMWAVTIASCRGRKAYISWLHTDVGIVNSATVLIDSSAKY